MKRIGLIATLFCIAFVFTQCNPCGSNPAPRVEVVGIENMSSNIVGIYTDEESSDIDSFGIFLNADFILARCNNFSPFTAAYACYPVEPYPRDIKPAQIDSIQIVSEPVFSEITRIDSLIYFNFSETVADYNASRSNNIGLSTRLYFKEPPAQSDSFTFSFYYYKDGAIIDSSFTKKYFISNQ